MPYYHKKRSRPHDNVMSTNKRSWTINDITRSVTDKLCLRVEHIRFFYYKAIFIHLDFRPVSVIPSQQKHLGITFDIS